ncbi:hypothetical protein V5O48_003940 [Marasmius crinis-equi]|uniref:F-box domain-containing protein n=1 Tax=Marasmius crinis-equi TaxID=585013 RepID=A0ABR3FRG7_9AGAR
MSVAPTSPGQLLLGVPMEIFYLICYNLPITTVLALLQVNQCLRYLLIDSEVFWRDIRTAKNIPDGPESLSELEWLTHLFRDPPKCQRCGGGYVLTNWQIMRRFCQTCTAVCTRGCSRNRAPVAAFPYIDAIPTYTDGQGVRRFVREDLADIVPACRALPLDERTPFLDHCKQAVQHQKDWADDLDTWFGNTVVGWFISDSVSPGTHALKELDLNHKYTQEMVLNANEWLTFRHQVLPQLRAKFTPPFLTSAERHWARVRSVLALAWDAYLRQQTKRIRFTAPDSTVIGLFPFVRDILILSHPSALDVDFLLKLIVDNADAIFRWISFLDRRLMMQSVERAYDPALVSFCHQRHLTLPSPSVPDDGLGGRELAITEVHCEACDEVFSSVGAGLRHVNRSSNLCISHWTGTPSMLSLMSSPAGIALVNTTGLDCVRTTCHEMDRLWHAYTCILCLGDFKGTWRECVKHFHKAGHKKEDNKYDFCLLFARLDPGLHNLLVPANDKPAWHCNYCSRYSGSPATRSQIIDHVVRAHEVDRGNFRVPDDFFYVGR